MPRKRARTFNTSTYLATAGPGRTIIRLKAKQILCSQGVRADCLFYLQTGRAKLTIVSKGGKEATVTLLAPGDFFGEECMAGPNEFRTTSATAITICMVLKIASAELTVLLGPTDWSRLPVGPSPVSDLDCFPAPDIRRLLLRYATKAAHSRVQVVTSQYAAFLRS